MPDDASLTIKLDPRAAAQLTSRARALGMSVEDYAAELVADGLELDALSPGLAVSDEELRASIEDQRRQIAAGTMKFHTHQEVMETARAQLKKALEAKS